MYVRMYVRTYVCIYVGKYYVCMYVCMYVNVCIYRVIQGDSGGICTTLGNDSMSDSKQNVRTNMGPILDGYGVMTA